MAYLRRFWVKEPRHSETISHDKCYLNRSTRPYQIKPNQTNKRTNQHTAPSNRVNRPTNHEINQLINQFANQHNQPKQPTNRPINHNQNQPTEHTSVPTIHPTHKIIQPNQSTNQPNKPTNQNRAAYTLAGARKIAPVWLRMSSISLLRNKKTSKRTNPRAKYRRIIPTTQPTNQ